MSFFQCLVDQGAASQETVMAPPALLLPQAQFQLQQQLLSKHRALEEAISRQQKQLRIISEQLMLASQIPMPSVFQNSQNYGKFPYAICIPDYLKL